MRKYELMYIVRPDLDEDATKAIMERFQNVVTEQGGEVVELKEMGKRRLAYEIQKYREGFYVLMYFNAEPHVVQEVERLLRINEDVIRHLVIKLEEK